MFRVGQKVVCVDARIPRYPGVIPVAKGAIYTIRDSGPEPMAQGEWWVLLNEITNISAEGLGELGYTAARFRPIVERKTDISIFTRMLTGQKQGADVNG